MGGKVEWCKLQPWWPAAAAAMDQGMFVTVHVPKLMAPDELLTADDDGDPYVGVNHRHTGGTLHVCECSREHWHLHADNPEDIANVGLRKLAERAGSILSHGGRAVSLGRDALKDTLGAVGDFLDAVGGSDDDEEDNDDGRPKGWN